MTGSHEKLFSFDPVQYDSELRRFTDDHSWEDVGRTVERLVSDVFKGVVTEEGFAFGWASTRIKANLVHLSFSKGSEQRILEFSWDGSTTESALARARSLQRERDWQELASCRGR
jgi:hypothetical protein